MLLSSGGTETSSSYRACPMLVFLNVLVAVVVNAITFTSGGRMLQTSLNLAYSVLNSSPLLVNTGQY